MRKAGGDVDNLEFVAADGVFDHVFAADLAEADDAAAADDEEFLGLGVVPVVAFDDAGPGDVDLDLAALGGADESWIPANT